MKNNKFKKSLFIATFIMLLFRLLFVLFPIHSSVATIIIPKDYELDEINFGIRGYTGRVKCININESFDKLNNQTIFSLNSRSLNKQKSIKCIEDVHIMNKYVYPTFKVWDIDKKNIAV